MMSKSRSAALALFLLLPAVSLAAAPEVEAVPDVTDCTTVAQANTRMELIFVENGLRGFSLHTEEDPNTGISKVIYAAPGEPLAVEADFLHGCLQESRMIPAPGTIELQLAPAEPPD